MPGRLFLTSPLSELVGASGAITSATEDEPPRQNIAPGQDVICLTAKGLSRMRWGIIPVGRVNARGRPVMETLINARSETVFDKSAYEGTGRAVVPINGWYEWTGEKRKKTAWRISAKGGGLLYFAAITDVWNGPGGVTLEQVATVTCLPNADVEPIHHRMGVLLRPSDISLWLQCEVAEARKLMVPWPDGQLCIEKAESVDWSEA